jgi:hypothetical protein
MIKLGFLKQSIYNDNKILKNLPYMIDRVIEVSNINILGYFRKWKK